MHAFHRLYQQRKSISTKAYKSRGWKVKRCEFCRLAEEFCICELRQQCNSNCSFLLLMSDDEVLKPSNTGRLIADVIPDTHAFIWHRTEVNDDLLSLLQDDKYQPFLVFPSEYASEQQRVYNQQPDVLEHSKIPLFILIDATWRQAKRIFRKSEYLAQLPIVSIESVLAESATECSNPVNNSAEQVHQKQHRTALNYDSRYQLRKAEKPGQLGTAEVAAKVLQLFGENESATLLDLWFDVFSFRYQQAVKQTNKANPRAVENFQRFINERTLK
ncbi:tRNA-uridine aminocarboxypropyltransferase [Thalassotalea sp. ND16A]|uniref:tRNA-uridine aminocarboxypropyltransferase n=1 Tax=Thalassotalea sp. ND16A TaxID=1535422 RepID=UPI00051A45F4|nr:DTW domain-containing protein [Thalassotalea sp. ND16A]KGJ87473.1 hypothetical protein ND16A_2856 [Thalassotalea sp. ND16A]